MVEGGHSMIDEAEMEKAAREIGAAYPAAYRSLIESTFILGSKWKAEQMGSPTGGWKKYDPEHPPTPGRYVVINKGSHLTIQLWASGHTWGEVTHYLPLPPSPEGKE